MRRLLYLAVLAALAAAPAQAVELFPRTGRILRSSIAGYVGRTGNLTCETAHVHFEVKQVGDWDKMVDPASVSGVFQWSVEP